MKRISVTYEESDVAKSLEQIINHPNSEEIVKLMTPLICESERAATHFFRVLIGNKLPDVIPNGTLVRIPIDKLGYLPVGSKDELSASKFADAEGRIIGKVRGFRGYHEYSRYIVEYTNIVGGIEKIDTRYLDDSDFEIFEEF